jgi:hypothetical protein
LGAVGLGLSFFRQRRVSILDWFVLSVEGSFESPASDARCGPINGCESCQYMLRRQPFPNIKQSTSFLASNGPQKAITSLIAPRALPKRLGYKACPFVLGFLFEFSFAADFAARKNSSFFADSDI